jgi:hypothetical protein
MWKLVQVESQEEEKIIWKNKEVLRHALDCLHGIIWIHDLQEAFNVPNAMQGLHICWNEIQFSNYKAR